MIEQKCGRCVTTPENCLRLACFEPDGVNDLNSFIRNCEDYHEKDCLVNPGSPPKDGTRIIATIDVRGLDVGVDYAQDVIRHSHGMFWVNDFGESYDMENCTEIIHWQPAPPLDKIIAANKEKSDA